MAELLKYVNEGFIGKVKYAVVKFDTNDSSLYAYKTMLTNLDQHDLIVVHCRAGFKIAHFGCYIAKDDRATDWIMHKVDESEYKRLMTGGYE